MASMQKRRNSLSILTSKLRQSGTLATGLIPGNDIDSILANGEYRRESDEYNPTMNVEESNVADAINISEASLDDFLKLNKLNPSELQFTWSIILSLWNIFTFFSIFYYIGISGFPEGSWLAIELLVEGIMVVDLIVRISMQKTAWWRRNWILHDATPLFLLWVGSFPISFMFFWMKSVVDLSSLTVAYIKLIKIFRVQQMWAFTNKLEIVLKDLAKVMLTTIKLVFVLFAMTHFCAMFWLLVARHEIDEGADDTWYQSWNEKAAQDYEEYIDGIFWATATMTSIGYGDIYPETHLERFLSVFVMILGATTYGSLFGTFVVILDELSAEKRENKEMLEQAKQWAAVRNLSQENLAKIVRYYSFLRPRQKILSHRSYLDQLPLAQRTQLLMHVYDDLIQQSKLFELGDPRFVMALIRHFKPHIFMSGDLVTRQGELASGMFFIRSGVVEALTADTEDIIAYMEDGHYFGEIGVLLQDRRSISTRVKFTTICSFIAKDKILEILHHFPEHEKFLRGVATQRAQSVYVGDIWIDAVIGEQYPSDQEMFSRKTTVEIKAAGFCSRLDWFGSFQMKVIDPFSKFYNIWAALVIISFLYNLFFVPIAICFDYEISEVGYYFLDIFAVCVAIFDIVVKFNSTLIHENGVMERNKSVIANNYANHMLVIDCLAAIPIDYIAIMASGTALAWIRLLRLLKFFRVKEILKQISTFSKLPMKLYPLIVYFVMFIYLTHLAACLFFFIGKQEFLHNSRVRYDNRTWFSTFGEQSFNDYPAMLDEDLVAQYIHCLYWAYASWGTIAYGDVIPITPAEKIYAFIVMITAKIFVAFVYAAAASLVSESNAAQTRHLAKESMIQQWVRHVKLPASLSKRVGKYYELLWNKLQGQNDSETLGDLPESLSTDIRLEIFSCFAESGLFPVEELGATIMIVRRCNVMMICEGETIMQLGEVGLEMYFILEGEVSIVSPFGLVVATLTKGKGIGEMALIQETASVRAATCVAKTDCALAQLGLEDFRMVMSKYEEFNKKVRRQAWHRSVVNRQFARRASQEQGLPPPAELEDDEPEEESVQYSSGEDFEDAPPANSPKHGKTETSVTADDTALNEVEKEDDSGRPEDLHSVDTTLQTEPNLIAVKPRPHRLKCIKKFVHSDSFMILLFVFSTLNFAFTPYQIAFQLEYDGVSLTMEIFTIIIYTANIGRYISVNKDDLNAMRGIRILHLILVAWPFALIYSLSDEQDPRIPIVITSLLRISDIAPIMVFYRFIAERFARKINIIRISQVLNLYLLLAHFVACMWIEMARIEDDETKSWIRRAPVPRDSGTRDDDSMEFTDKSLYIHAIYWSIVTFSHIGVGDITAITIAERAFNCFVILIYTFAYAILFGNMASLVSGLANNAKSQMYKKYQYVMRFLSKKELQVFRSEVQDYFNYSWSMDMGLDQQELLRSLPTSLATDIRLARYANIIQKSDLFMDSRDEVIPELTRSLFRIMEIRYCLVGDDIITSSNTNTNIYLILDGKADLLDEKENILETLWIGDYIGDSSLIDEDYDEFSVRSQTICQVGVISQKYMNFLFEAFPEWSTFFLQKVQERLDILFGDDRIEGPTQSNPKLHSVLWRKDITKVHGLGALEEADVERKYIWFDIVHLLLLVYSYVVITLILGFNIALSPTLMALELICFIESVLYIVFNIRMYQLAGIRTFREILEHYARNGLVLDLFAASPFNLILGGLELVDPIWVIVPLRLLRIIAIGRIPRLLEKVEIVFLYLGMYISAMKTILFLWFLWHFAACMWFFVNLNVDDDDADTWVDYHKLNGEPLHVQYNMAIYFTINIVTSVGYGDMFGTTDTERIATCIIILTGDALFAVAFGMLASLAEGSSNELSDYLSQINLLKKYLNDFNIPPELHQQVDQFLAYRWGIKQQVGSYDMKHLYEFIPTTMVEKILFESHQKILRQVPLFSTIKEQLIKMISTYLQPEIFLPGSAVIQQGDVGQEMFFVVEGTLHVLSPDNKLIAEHLTKGQFIGESALLNQTARPFNVFAATFCLLYLLKHKDFEDILMAHPEIAARIRRSSRERSRKLTSLMANFSSNTNLGKDLENSQLFKELDQGVNPKIFQINVARSAGRRVLTGEFLKQDMDRGEKWPMRRPLFEAKEASQRRLSQIGIGREILRKKVKKLNNLMSHQEKQKTNELSPFIHVTYDNSK